MTFVVTFVETFTKDFWTSSAPCRCVLAREGGGDKSDLQATKIVFSACSQEQSPLTSQGRLWQGDAGARESMQRAEKQARIGVRCALRIARRAFFTARWARALARQVRQLKWWVRDDAEDHRASAPTSCKTGSRISSLPLSSYLLPTSMISVSHMTSSAILPLVGPPLPVGRRASPE